MLNDPSHQSRSSRPQNSRGIIISPPVMRQIELLIGDLKLFVEDGRLYEEGRAIEGEQYVFQRFIVTPVDVDTVNITLMLLDETNHYYRIDHLPLVLRSIDGKLENIKADSTVESARFAGVKQRRWYKLVIDTDQQHHTRLPPSPPPGEEPEPDQEGELVGASSSLFFAVDPLGQQTFHDE